MNMKNSYPDSLSWIFAIILSLGFYALLFFPFQFQARVTPSKNKPVRHLADVVMLPLGKDSNFPWQNNLIASLELLDPTIMSLPNSSHGFSNVRSLEFERPIEPLPPHPIGADLAQEPVQTQFFVTPPISDLFSVINATHFLEHQLPKPKPRLTMDSTVYWTNEGGEILDHLPSISLKDAAENGKKLTTFGPTQVVISYRGDLARVKLLNSCGIPRLDKMAVDSLRRYFTKEQAKLTATSSNKQEAKKDTQIFAYWRYASEVSESANIHSENKLYDWDWF